MYGLCSLSTQQDCFYKQLHYPAVKDNTHRPRGPMCWVVVMYSFLQSTRLCTRVTTRVCSSDVRRVITKKCAIFGRQQKNPSRSNSTVLCFHSIPKGQRVSSSDVLRVSISLVDSESVDRRTHIPQTSNSTSVHTGRTSVKGKHQRRILTWRASSIVL